MSTETQASRLIASLKSALRPAEDGSLSNLHSWTPPDLSDLKLESTEAELARWLSNVTAAHEACVQQCAQRIDAFQSLSEGFCRQLVHLEDCASCYGDILLSSIQSKKHYREEAWLAAGQDAISESAKAKYLLTLQVAKLKAIQPYEFRSVAEQFFWESFMMRIEEDTQNQVDIHLVDRAVVEAHHWDTVLQKLIDPSAGSSVSVSTSLSSSLSASGSKPSSSKVYLKRMAFFAPSQAGKHADALCDEFITGKKAKRKCGRILTTREGVQDAVREILAFSSSVRAVDSSLKIVTRHGDIGDYTFTRYLPRTAAPLPSLPVTQLLSSKTIGWLLTRTAEDLQAPVLDGKIYVCVEERDILFGPSHSGSGIASAQNRDELARGGVNLSTLSPSKRRERTAMQDQHFLPLLRSKVTFPVYQRGVSMQGEVLEADAGLHFVPATLGDLIHTCVPAFGNLPADVLSSIKTRYGHDIVSDPRSAAPALGHLYVVRSNELHGVLTPLDAACLQELTTVYLYRGGATVNAFALNLEPQDELKYSYVLVYGSTQNQSKPWAPLGLAQFEIYTDAEKDQNDPQSRGETFSLLQTLSQSLCSVAGCMRSTACRKTRKCAHHAAVDMSVSALRNESLRLLSSGLLPFNSMQAISKLGQVDTSAAAQRDMMRHVEENDFRAFFDDWADYPETALRTKQLADGNLTHRTRAEAYLVALSSGSGRGGGKLWQRYVSMSNANAEQNDGEKHSPMSRRRKRIEAGGADMEPEIEAMRAVLVDALKDDGRLYADVIANLMQDRESVSPEKRVSGLDGTLTFSPLVGADELARADDIEDETQVQQAARPATSRTSSLAGDSHSPSRSVESELEKTLRTKQQMLLQEKRHTRELQSLLANNGPLTDKQRHLLHYLVNNAWPAQLAFRNNDEDYLRAKAKALRSMTDAIFGNGSNGSNSARERGSSADSTSQPSSAAKSSDRGGNGMSADGSWSARGNSRPSTSSATNGLQQIDGGSTPMSRGDASTRPVSTSRMSNARPPTSAGRNSNPLSNSISQSRLASARSQSRAGSVSRASASRPRS